MRAALIAMLYTAAAVGAAPLPRPVPVAAETLAGATWQFEWGDRRGGVIGFHADGTYAAILGGDEVYHGRWWVTREGSIRLVEHRYNPATGAVCGPQNYEFTLRREGPALVGRTPDGTRVALSDPRRP